MSLRAMADIRRVLPRSSARALTKYADPVEKKRAESLLRLLSGIRSSVHLGTGTAGSPEHGEDYRIMVKYSTGHYTIHFLLLTRNSFLGP